MVYKLSCLEKAPASPWKPIGMVEPQDDAGREGWFLRKADCRIPRQNSMQASVDLAIVDSQSSFLCVW